MARVFMAVLAVTLVALWLPAMAGAQEQPPGPGGGRWKDWGVQLLALLDDPEAVAAWGRNDAERAAIVDQLRALVKHPSYSSNRPYTPAQLAAIAAANEAAMKDQGFDPPVVGPAPDPGPEWSIEDLSALDIGDFLDRLYNSDPDRGEMPYQVAGKDGSDEIAEAMAEAAEAAEQAWASGTSDPLSDQLNARGGPARDPETSGPPPPDGEFPCDGRTGTRSAPPTGTRPGTVFTPTQDTWVEDGSMTSVMGSGRDVADVGELQVRTKLTMSGTVRQFKVEAHVIDEGGMDPSWLSASLAYAPLDYFRTHLYLMWPGQADPYQADYYSDVGSNLIDYEVYCYADDAGLADKVDLTRGYVEAWLPFENPDMAQDLSEPGFQVRAVTHDYYLTGALQTFFLGSDMTTVHLGPEPLANSEGAPGGVGLVLDDTFVEDKNSTADDDIEATLEPPLESGVAAAVGALDGTSDYVLASGIPDWGWLGYTLSNVGRPGSTDVEWSTTSTTSGGATDDERLLRAKISVSDVPISGWASLPVAAAGLVPCFFQAEADVQATLTMGLDRSGTGLDPDASFQITGSDVHDVLVTPIPLGCNWMYLLNVDDISTSLLRSGDLTPFVADGIDDQLAIVHDIPSLSLPTGGRLRPEVDGFERTCDPYGCDGLHAGDIALTGDGVEAAASVGLLSDAGYIARYGPLFGISEPTARFPVSYRPSGITPVDDVIRSHTTPSGDTFSAAAVVSPDVLNQALATLTEGSGDLDGSFTYTSLGNGLLDVTSTSFNSVPQVAPIFLEDSGYDLGLFLPDLEFDVGTDEYFALNLAVGVDVGLGSDGTTMVPSVALEDVAAGLGIYKLRCQSLLSLDCIGIPSVLSSVASYLGTNVLPTLIEEPLALIEVPELSGIRFTSGEVENVGGNLVAYLRAG